MSGLNLEEKTITALLVGKLNLQGRFVFGSNYTFLLDVVYEELHFSAVYKPLQGEMPLWDFPARTLAKREAAAYRVSSFLGWNLVPPTVYRRRAPLGAGSLQQFIDHDPEKIYFTLSAPEHQKLRPAVVFDLLINNADRKGGHVLAAADGHLWFIDHGLCFHRQEKLRTVMWDFVGEPIPATLLLDVQRLVQELENKSAFYEQLLKYLKPGEIKALLRRAMHILEDPVFPSPAEDRRPYPWPLV